MILLKDYIKSLKNGYKTVESLPIQERLYLGKLFLEQEGADNTLDYRRVLDALEKLAKNSRDDDIEKWAMNALEKIMPDIKEAWNEGI